MSFLYFLEGIRAPWLDSIVSIITHLGEELVFMAIALVIFWCIDKFEGYYILSVGFLGTVLNQFLKITFRIPRPWVTDKNFSIVESARAEATGYSFPSGHTQSSVGTFGSLAYWNKSNVIRVIGIILCILVPFSRMYLGVHTPKDVIVSVVIALILILTIKPIIEKGRTNKKVMWWFLGVMAVLTLIGTLYVLLYNFPADVDAENLLSAKKNFCKLFGCIVGMLFVYFIDSKYINFKTEATFLGQIIKLLVGLAIIVALKEGLKPLLNLVFGGTVINNAIRYFLIVVFAGAVWPLSFKKLSTFGKSKNYLKNRLFSADLCLYGVDKTLLNLVKYIDRN